MLADAASGALIYFGAEKDNASLAAAGGDIYIRAKSHLYRIGGKTEAGK